MKTRDLEDVLFRHYYRYRRTFEENPESYRWRTYSCRRFKVHEYQRGMMASGTWICLAQRGVKIHDSNPDLISDLPIFA
jgi:hypothetical protein